MTGSLVEFLSNHLTQQPTRPTMPSSILIIDDSPQARRQVIDILQEKPLFNFYYEASDGIEGFKIALNKKIDLVLCDLEMPGMDGFKFLQMLNGREELADLPVILVTGREDTETKVKGLEQGASDYVTKPFDPAELLARVKVQLKLKSLQDKLKQSNQMLLELSITDPLTGLNNRRSMMEVLEKEFDRHRRSGKHIGLIMIDIDHFKKVNDTYGHQKGDVVLQGLATLLKRHLRQYDTAARFGGEEFALILPETDLEEAARVAERLRRAAENLSFDKIPGLQISASLGVACFPGEGIDTPDDLIREADYALYNAKRHGRNRVERAEG